MRFVILDKDEYHRFEQQNPKGSFYQSIYQKAYFDKSRQTSGFFGVTENDKILLGALIRKIDSRFGGVYEIMAGPLVDPNFADQDTIIAFFLSELRSYLKKLHAYYLRIVPNETIQRIDNAGHISSFDFSKYVSTYEKQGFIYDSLDQIGYSSLSPNYEYHKDLAGFNAETLFQSFSKATQYSIRKTFEFAIKTRTITYDELTVFHENTSQTAARLGFQDKSLAYYQNVYKTFGKQARFVIAEIELPAYVKHFQATIQLLTEEIDQLAAANSKKSTSSKHRQVNELEDRIRQYQKRIDQAETFIGLYGNKINLAGALFFIQPQEVSYMFSYTNVEFKNFYGPYRIQYEMLKFAQSQKMPVYNFYGVSGDNSRKDGVYEFKKGFNGYMTRNIGTFILPISKTRYRLLQQLRKIIRR